MLIICHLRKLTSDKILNSNNYFLYVFNIIYILFIRVNCRDI